MFKRQTVKLLHTVQYVQEVNTRDVFFILAHWKYVNQTQKKKKFPKILLKLMCDVNGIHLLPMLNVH